VKTFGPCYVHLTLNVYAPYLLKPPAEHMTWSAKASYQWRYWQGVRCLTTCILKWRAIISNIAYEETYSAILLGIANYFFFAARCYA